ncbi:MAG: hypothetical protein Q4A37_01360 [Candidatus Saccharibacteria bacterium]|nr:hypothetical protein [Candidatus Saccharibacteria bacterium]
MMTKQDEQKSIDEVLAELEAAVAWFHGDEFSLDEAREKFTEAQRMAADAEVRLMEMKHEIEVLQS